jgi:enhancer of polycomb-like protein
LQAALATKAVFIPTPGVIGVADNYNELYPQNKWKDPISFLKTTQTVEEACSNALVDHEFTYYMDEIDKQWLDKNNQEARGEGTSAQGARSARKGKDKEPEMGVPVSISEDEFELVMGLLEKITEQKVIACAIRCYFCSPLVSRFLRAMDPISRCVSISS